MYMPKNYSFSKSPRLNLFAQVLCSIRLWRSVEALLLITKQAFKQNLSTGEYNYI